MTVDQMIPMLSRYVEDDFSQETTEHSFTLCWLDRRLTVKWGAPLRESARIRRAEFRAVWDEMTQEDPF